MLGDSTISVKMVLDGAIEEFTFNDAQSFLEGLKVTFFLARRLEQSGDDFQLVAWDHYIEGDVWNSDEVILAVYETETLKEYLNDIDAERRGER